MNAISSRQSIIFNCPHSLTFLLVLRLPRQNSVQINTQRTAMPAKRKTSVSILRSFFIKVGSSSFPDTNPMAET